MLVISIVRWICGYMFVRVPFPVNATEAFPVRNVTYSMSSKLRYSSPRFSATVPATKTKIFCSFLPSAQLYCAHLNSRAFDGTVPSHFYGEMSKTELGCQVLQEKGHFVDFAHFIRQHGLESDDPELILKLKSILWAVVCYIILRNSSFSLVILFLPGQYWCDGRRSSVPRRGRGHTDYLRYCGAISYSICPRVDYKRNIVLNF